MGAAYFINGQISSNGCQEEGYTEDKIWEDGSTLSLAVAMI